MGKDNQPTWKEAAQIYLSAIQSGTPEGIEAGINGINDMAAACDDLNEKITLITVEQNNVKNQRI